MALQHPTWLMGQKVTIDSATLMNKGLEVMEAHWLFGLAYDRISVILHRESIVHSMVEFVDGSIKAQLEPAGHATAHSVRPQLPARLPNPFPRLDLTTQHSLTFGPVDMGRYPCLRLACQAGTAAGTYPAVLSAADEVAVSLFLEGRLPFTGIPDVVASVLDAHRGTAHPDLDTILAADQWARAEALDAARRMAGS